MDDFNVNDVQINLEINKEAIIERKYEYYNEQDGSIIFTIKKGEKIKVLGQNYEHYCYICEYKGERFHCVDVIGDKKSWKTHGDPNTDILVTYI